MVIPFAIPAHSLASAQSLTSARIRASNETCSSGTQPCPLHYQVKEYRDNLLKVLTEQKIDYLKEDMALGKVFVKN
jgi:hypothetical protein